MTVEKIITKAEKLAVNMLKKEISRRRRTGVGIAGHNSERYLKHFYLKGFWKQFYNVCCERYEAALTDCGSLGYISEVFQQQGFKECTVRNILKWIEVRFANTTFRILESEGRFYVVATSMDAFQIKMNVADLFKVLVAYDSYTSPENVDALLQQVLLEVSAEEKSIRLLTLTARALIADLLEGDDVKFEVRMQKNGRLCCTILPWASWLPSTMFRTSLETFREDFIKSFKDFRTRKCKFGYH